MLRINPGKRLHVSNRLALAAALALALTLFTGMDGMQDPASAETVPPASLLAEANAADDSEDASRRTKRFSVSRLLFGHG